MNKYFGSSNLLLHRTALLLLLYLVLYVETSFTFFAHLPEDKKERSSC